MLFTHDTEVNLVFFAALLDTVALAYPSRRYSSAWPGIIVHSLQSVLIVGASLALVLR